MGAPDSIKASQGSTYTFDDGRPEIVDSKREIQVKTLWLSQDSALDGYFRESGPTGLRLFNQ